MRSFVSIALSVCLCLSCATSIGAQNLVQINEIEFDEQWVEIANFDTMPVDLGAWSIYQATQTQGAPQGYWWPIPPGTIVPAGQFLRVRWLRPVQSGNTNPLLIDTGDTSYHFLFFLRGEPLSRSTGALGLVATKDGGLVNTASYYRDFVAWGNATTPFPREELAVQNGRWRTGARTLTATTGQSLALDARDLSEPTPVGAFFRDTSPTPSLPNQGTQSATLFGTECVLGLGAPSQLTFQSVPVHGNADFRIVVDNLVDSRTVVWMYLGMPMPAGRPWVAPCRTYFDLDLPYSGLPLTPTGDTLSYRPAVEDFTIPQVAVQAVALRPNGTIVLTNGGWLRN